MKYLLERIRLACGELKNNEQTQLFEIENFEMREGYYKDINDIKNLKDGWKNYKSGEYWGTADTNYWFRTQISIPKNKLDKTIAITVRDGDGWDPVIKPQFALYINQDLIQGIDIHHREVVIDSKYLKNNNSGELNLDFNAYSGMVNDSGNEVKNRLHVSISEINNSVRKLYYDLIVPVKIIECLNEDDKIRIDAITILNEAINFLDFRIPKSEEFYKSVELASEYLEKNYYSKFSGHEDIIATCVGHTHIDVAWWWTVAQTRQKTLKSFATVVNMMKEYPEYIFMSSQPQLYKFVKEEHPELYSEIKKLIKEGRWEAEGGMWLEADTNVTSGESLVRQLLFGTRFFKKEFDVENKILWLPDVFGYSAALPQILKKSDIDYFMTTKIAWNQYNKFPYDTFNWEGIDGSKVLSHFVTTQNANQVTKSHFTTYNGTLNSADVIGAWRRYQQKEINNDVLISYGNGDGGGGPTKEMLEYGKRLSRGLAGAPKVQQGTSRKYFEKLEKTVANNRRLPNWVGELYLEYHRGTYTSMARNKKFNRKSEFLYQDLECISSVAKLFGDKYNKELINNSWETILLNQFHDILPGTSIKEVYDVNKIEYENILKLGQEEINSKLKFIGSQLDIQNNSILVFNTLSHERNDIVKVKINQIFNSQDEINVFDGNTKLNSQIIKEKEEYFLLFDGNKIPAKGFKTFKFERNNSENNNVANATKSFYENNLIRVEFDEKMQIKSFYDKEDKRQILKANQKGNVLIAFEDRPMYFDNWDIDCFYKEKMWIVDDLESCKILEQGPIRTTFEIKRKFLNSTIIQKLYFYENSKKIDFDTYIDWKQSQILLKVSFPVDVHTNKATYDIQFGNVERPTHQNTSWDEARFEVCGHKWADVSEEGYGVTLMNDCKYGHDIFNSDMRLTLLKSGIVPNPTTDQEEHNFTYSILPHNGNWKAAKVYEQAYELNVPTYSYIIENNNSDKKIENNFSLINTASNNIIIDTVKEAEDSENIIIRMFETIGKRTVAKINFGYSAKNIILTNLMEKEIVPIEIKNDNSIELIFKPYEILTIKIETK